MTRTATRLVLLALFLPLLLLGSPGTRADETDGARGDTIDAALAQIAGSNYDGIEAGIAALAAADHAPAADLLSALGDRRAYVAPDGRLLYRDTQDVLRDARTGAEVDQPGRLKNARVNNRIRRAIETARGTLNLTSPNDDERKIAAEAVFRSRDPAALSLLERAIARETDTDIRAMLERARGAALLFSDAADDAKLAAIDVVVSRGDQAALSLLGAVAGDTSTAPAVATAAAEGMTVIEDRLAMWASAQSIVYGLSLGSVLLLAAIGLAVTFGVMGVINMAHGEMVMIGAYTTYVVQEAIRLHAPHLFDASLAIALPLAFLAAALVGIAIERGVIRWLYGRPLETLLATWGISLILQQAVRSVFGSSNREVGSPSWMSGAFEFGPLTLTYGRLWIILFALAVFAVLLFVIRRSRLGLEMRAVTQNRRMAASMGIRTHRVDCLTFGLGSGIAGIAGVALSQIDNVSPNLGQSYIIDSFLVVVFGGVGNLWGTLVAAMTLGVTNKFLEPYTGAVLGKIIVLVFIVLFIQRRPRGLFPQRGRAAEA